MPFIVTAEEADNFVLPTDVEPRLSVNNDFFLVSLEFPTIHFQMDNRHRMKETAGFSAVFGSSL